MITKKYNDTAELAAQICGMWVKMDRFRRIRFMG